MCLIIDTSVTSLNKRTVWKVFDRAGSDRRGKIVSLYMAAEYPKGKLIERSSGRTTAEDGTGTRGLHFYVSKTRAKREAKLWYKTYIAKFTVDPNDFMFASADGEVMYERATRVGNYVRVA